MHIFWSSMCLKCFVMGRVHGCVGYSGDYRYTSIKFFLIAKIILCLVNLLPMYYDVTARLDIKSSSSDVEDYLNNYIVD